MLVSMDIQDQDEVIRSMRAQGLSPKQIARELGISPATASRLVRDLAARAAADTTEQPVRGCWVNAGWSEGLTFDPRPGWEDHTEQHDRPGGLVAVLVARDAGRSRLTLCGYLVDVHCLGVKDVIGPQRMNAQQCDDFTRSFFCGFDLPPLAVPLDLAQDLVFGGIAYARTLGFEPAPDFEEVREHLGTWSGPSAITFGRDGRPFYVQGPYDDADRIMRQLQRSAGAGRFHYLVSA
jgi:hypothetical protein